MICKILPPFTAYANRSCVRTSENEGEWVDPVLDDCISAHELELKNLVSIRNQIFCQQLVYNTL